MNPKSCRDPTHSGERTANRKGKGDICKVVSAVVVSTGLSSTMDHLSYGILLGFNIRKSKANACWAANVTLPAASLAIAVKKPMIAPDHLNCKSTFFHKLKEKRKKTTRS